MTMNVGYHQPLVTITKEPGRHDHEILKSEDFLFLKPGKWYNEISDEFVIQIVQVVLTTTP